MTKRHWARLISGSAAILTVLVVGVALAAPGGRSGGVLAPTGADRSAGGQPAPVAQEGFRPIVVLPDRMDLSPELRAIPPIPPQPGEWAPENPGFSLRQGGSVDADEVTAILQDWHGSSDMPAPIQNWEGVNNRNGVLPPDTEGDVGPNHYIQWVNLSFAIYDKTGNLLYGPVNGNTLWSGFGGPCQNYNSGDPIVVYDQLADRWLMTQFALPSAPYYQCIAVSQTSDPLGAWHRYAYAWPNNKMNDYPKFGVWPDGYYMTANQFNPNWAGAGVAAFERDKMLQGQPAQMIYFDLYNVNSNYGGMLPADWDGNTPPPEGAPNYFLEWDDSSWIPPNDAVRIWEFHVDWATPANSTFGINGDPNYVINTANVDPNMCNYSRNCIPQPGTTRKLDAISDRVMYQLQYRNFGCYEAMVTNHTVDASGSDRAGIHWFELRKVGGTWSLYQQGVYSPDSVNRWMGSIAMDAQGNIALGYSVSDASSVYPGVRYAGRLVSDPLGTLPQAEVVMQAGSGYQSSSSSRWGDYSMMSVDPTDDCTFWYTNEYIQTSGNANWQTRIAAFKFPGCVGGAGVTLYPPTAAQSGDPGAAVLYTLRVTNTGYVADTFNLSVSGNAWPTSVAATVGPLAPRAGADVVVTVNIPADAPCGGSDSATVTATSQRDTCKTDTSHLTTSATGIYGVAVAPPEAAQAGDPGTVVVYTLRVTNTGTCPDTFDLSVSGNAWPTSAPATVGPLQPAAGADVAVSVSIPPEASCGEWDTATVAFVSQGDGSTSDAAELTTSVYTVYGVSVDPPSAAQAGEPGAAVVYALRVTNTGNCEDSFDIALAGNLWPVSAPAAVGPLAGGEWADVSVTVTVPEGAPCGDLDTVTVALTSQHDGSAVDESVLSTAVLAVYGVEVIPAEAAQEGEPGTEVVYTLRVTNTGTCTDTLDVAVSGNAWPVSAPAVVGPLGRDAGADLDVVVTVPAGAPCGALDSVTVALTSQHDASATDSSVLTTSVVGVYGVEVAPAEAAQEGDPGAAVLYTLRVTNTGTCVDTLDVSVSGNAWPVSAPAAVGPLQPGAGADVQVEVSVPPMARCGDEDLAVVSFTSQGDGSATAGSTLSTSANAVYSVDVTPASAAQSGAPGTAVVYTLWVMNGGNCVDTFDLATSGHTWPVDAPIAVGPLLAGAGVSVQITVTIPVSAGDGETDMATLLFVSQGDGGVSDTSTLLTTAVVPPPTRWLVYLPIVLKQ